MQIVRAHDNNDYDKWWWWRWCWWLIYSWTCKIDVIQQRSILWVSLSYLIVHAIIRVIWDNEVYSLFEQRFIEIRGSQCDFLNCPSKSIRWNIMTSWNRTNAITAIVTITAASVGPTYSRSQIHVSEAVLSHFITYILKPVNFLLSPLGVAASFVNIIIYCRQGIRESVNITFISLSSFNMIISFMFCVTEILHTIGQFASIETVNMMSLLEVYLTYSRGFTYIQVTLITVFLSLERCICIMFPVGVKHIFTPRRVIIINFIIAIFGIACHTPVWVSQGMHWVFDPSSNATRFEMWSSHIMPDVELFSITFNSFILPVFAQIHIAVFTGYMLRGLNQSMKFRHKCATARESVKSFSGKEECLSVTTKVGFVERRKTMTSKDVMLTKVVVLLAVKYFIGNIPVLMISFLGILIPDIRFGKQHYNLYMMLYNLAFEFRVFNCMVDMLIYYKVSSKYRKEFLALFSKYGFFRKM